jgi:Protein of unknown function (DUF5674)
LWRSLQSKGKLGENKALIVIPLMIQIIRNRATPEQMQQMLEVLGIYIKLAVDIQRGILAGGGEFHADCEQILLEDGSEPVHVWGADWYPLKQSVGYESLINIRPRVGNRSMEIQDPAIRAQINRIVQNLLGNVSWQ